MLPGEIIGRVAVEVIMVDTSELAQVTKYHDKWHTGSTSKALEALAVG